MSKSASWVALLLVALSSAASAAESGKGNAAGAEAKGKSVMEKAAKANKTSQTTAASKGKSTAVKGAQANMAAKQKQNETAANVAKARHETARTTARNLR